MTKFLDFYNIFPIPDPKEFLGISPDRQEDRILTTLGKSFVLVLDVSNNKQKHSWTITEKLSTKVVYDRCTEKYVGAFGNRALRCWDESTEDVNKSKKLRFQRSIEDLITNDEGNAFVVYADGNLESLTIALQTRKDKTENLEIELSLPYTLSKPQILRLDNGGQVYTCFRRCNRTNQLSLVTHFMTEEGTLIRENAKEHIICQANSNVRVVAYAVIEAELGIMLITIWSDKRIFMLDILEKDSISEAPGKYVSMINEIDVNSPLCLNGVSKNFIVIYGSTPNKDGGMLLLYNTQYKVIKAKQYFKVFFNVARVWPMKEHILLAMGQNLSAVSYRISKALLAELIGTQSSNLYDTFVEEEQLNDLEDFDENLNFVNEKAKDSCLQPSRIGQAKDSILAQDDIEIDCSKADGKKIPFQPYETLESKLNTLWQTLLHVDVVETSKRKKPDLDVISNVFDYDFTHPLILNVVQQMEKCGASEQEIGEKLMSVLVKTDCKEDILACLSRYTNYSEKTLAKALKYVLVNFSKAIDDVIAAKDIVLTKEGSTKNVSLCEEDEEMQNLDKSSADLKGKRRRTLSRSSIKSDKSDKKPVVNGLSRKNSSSKEDNSLHNKKSFKFLNMVLDQEMHNIRTSATINLENLPFELKLLNKILSHHFQGERMSTHLRDEISYPEMIKLLKYLFILIKCKDVFQFELYPKYQPSCADFELQIFRWFGSLINAHFQQMILSKDKLLINILLRWHKLFLLYKFEARQLQETAAILYKIVHKSKNSSDTNYVKWYSIEEVQLF